MDAWIIALAIVVAALAALTFIPIRLAISLRGRADPSGAWALASGAEIGPFAVSAVGARGVEARAALHVFGKKFWQKELRELGRRRESEEDVGERSERFLAEQRARYAKLERWFDPLDLVIFVLRERRRVRIDRLELDVHYSFRDVVLTGKLTAALFALSGALPAPVLIRPMPSWESLDEADLALAGAIRVWPVLLLVDSAYFVVRRVKLRKRPSAAGPTEAT